MRSLLLSIRTYWLACSAVIFVAVTVLSLWPADSLPSVPGGDKLHHLVTYAALVFPVALRKPRFWKLIVVLFIAYSGVIELVQPFVNRYGDWWDMAANSTGLACGVLIAVGLRKHFLPVRQYNSCV
ncbi:MAG: VanZ family protein [Candidatus Electrothrix sp. GM3_4]|nr:VanZ family protein [Candidatus Electrothrix sp. GM3_4]